MKFRAPYPDVEEKPPVREFEQAGSALDAFALGCAALPEPAPVMHQGENRVQRRAAVATWTPPEQPISSKWQDMSGERIAAMQLGMQLNADDGSVWRVAVIDRDRRRIRLDSIATQQMPTRRELLEQRQRRAKGWLSPAVRRMQHQMLRKRKAKT